MRSFSSPVFSRAVSLALVLSLAACSGTPIVDEQRQTPINATVSDGHTSRNALDWAGTYSGVMPCASCPGIETTVTLNADGSFERRMVYIDESPAPFVETGRFVWDDAGRNITLTGDGTATSRYQVGEHQLFHLDQDGQRIDGELSAHYMLHQHIKDSRIEDRHWTLVELHGRTIEVDKQGRKAFIVLRAEDSRAHGNAACNMFNGVYAIKTGQRIEFSRNMAMTMMACPDMQIEQQFIEVLQTVDNYSLGDNGTLTLNRARMAPLARFVESPGAQD